MRLSTLLWLAMAMAVVSCGSDTTAPIPPEGVWGLVEENGEPLPTDPFRPVGCCLTLRMTLAFSADTYELHGFYRNKNNGLEFENVETGTFLRETETLYFVRTGGGGVNAPYLLAPGVLSEDASLLTLLYGDEGPGSNQVRGVFLRGID